jgi:hypothetical protein
LKSGETCEVETCEVESPLTFSDHGSHEKSEQPNHGFTRILKETMNYTNEKAKNYDEIS